MSEAKIAVRFAASSADVEVPAKAQRRIFNAEEKKRILEATDRALAHGGGRRHSEAGRNLLLDSARVAQRARSRSAQSLFSKEGSAAAAESVGRRKREVAPAQSTFAGRARESSHHY